ncbi:MAG TPA: TadE/TadG family type IV pilus assembly protein [Blastocatellia bacterium]|nr:TadE/TadG family type IV pilus assembly protein [Blastocatellia bacterium]
MLRHKKVNNVERGATLVEFAIAGPIFFAAVFGIIEFSRLLWTHNALADAACQGARYAAISPQNATEVKNMVVYGAPNPAPGANPLIYGLTTGNVEVTYNGFGVKQGGVEVKITGYQFTFSVPLIEATLVMGDYHTALTGESAGFAPPFI